MHEISFPVDGNCKSLYTCDYDRGHNAAYSGADVTCPATRHCMRGQMSWACNTHFAWVQYHLMMDISLIYIGKLIH
jgi:hypothetical protein